MYLLLNAATGGTALVAIVTDERGYDATTVITFGCTIVR